MSNITNPDPYLTVAEAAAWTNLSHMTVRRAIYADQLRASRVGTTLRIRLSDLEAWMKSGVTR